MKLAITDIRFHPCARDLRSSGLRGWATITVNDELILDSLQVRRTLDGRNVISFPTRLDANGVAHPYYRTATPGCRSSIETQVLRELAAKGWVFDEA